MSNLRICYALLGPTLFTISIKVVNTVHAVSLSVRAGDLLFWMGRCTSLSRTSAMSNLIVCWNSCPPMLIVIPQQPLGFKATSTNTPLSRLRRLWGRRSHQRSSLSRCPNARPQNPRGHRALRKAMAIGSVRSRSSLDSQVQGTPTSDREDHATEIHGTQTAACLREPPLPVIRQHQLDAGSWAYAADYCGTATREMPADQVETFINDLPQRAAKDRPD